MASKNIIPFFGLDRQYANLKQEVLDVTDRVLSTGRVLDGNYTKAFENEIARRCDRQFAITVNSCSQAILMALQTIECGPTGGQVIIPAVSFAATLNSVMLTEHTPVMVDVDHNALIDLETMAESINDQSIVAIMYVNLFGNVINYDRFKVLTEFFGRSPLIIEDAAQSFGASYRGIPSGKLGDVSVLSFDPTKNLPNYGSGGMILTDNETLAESFQDLKDNGKRSDHYYPGTNSKMSEVDCATMMVKLNYFDAWQRRRTAIADYYIEQLYPYVDIVLPNEGVTHAWHKFVLRADSRSILHGHLSNEGIETKVHYEKALSDLPLYSSLDTYYNAEEFCKKSLSLPIYPELTDAEVEFVAQSVKDFFY